MSILLGHVGFELSLYCIREELRNAGVRDNTSSYADNQEYVDVIISSSVQVTFYRLPHGALAHLFSVFK